MDIRLPWRRAWCVIWWRGCRWRRLGWAISGYCSIASGVAGRILFPVRGLWCCLKRDVEANGLKTHLQCAMRIIYINTCELYEGDVDVRVSLQGRVRPQNSPER